MIPRVLAIAGSDSGGGAGIQADIKTITMLGGHAMTAITAITAQNTLGVDGVMPVPPDLVVAQIEAVARDIGVDAVKIGMVGSAATAQAIAALLAPDWKIVFDPMMIATSGAALADAATIAAFALLMARASLVTPNLPELQMLTGRTIADVEDLRDAAVALARQTGSAVLAKGGHLPGRQLCDVLIDPAGGGQEHRWSGPRIETAHTHGTGCTLSSAIATELAGRADLPGAIARARDYVRAAIRAAPNLGGGHGPMGHGLGRSHFGPSRDA